MALVTQGLIGFRIGSSVSVCKYLKRIGVQEETDDKYCIGTGISIKTIADAGRSTHILAETQLFVKNCRLRPTEDTLLYVG
jgi:hypothetical protein